MSQKRVSKIKRLAAVAGLMCAFLLISCSGDGAQLATTAEGAENTSQTAESQSSKVDGSEAEANSATEQTQAKAEASDSVVASGFAGSAPPPLSEEEIEQRRANLIPPPVPAASNPGGSTGGNATDRGDAAANADNQTAEDTSSELESENGQQTALTTVPSAPNTPSELNQPASNNPPNNPSAPPANSSGGDSPQNTQSPNTGTSAPETDTVSTQKPNVEAPNGSQNPNSKNEPAPSGKADTRQNTGSDDDGKTNGGNTIWSRYEEEVVDLVGDPSEVSCSAGICLDDEVISNTDPNRQLQYKPTEDNEVFGLDQIEKENEKIKEINFCKEGESTDCIHRFERPNKAPEKGTKCAERPWWPGCFDPNRPTEVVSEEEQWADDGTRDGTQVELSPEALAELLSPSTGEQSSEISETPSDS